MEWFLRWVESLGIYSDILPFIIGYLIVGIFTYKKISKYVQKYSFHKLIKISIAVIIALILGFITQTIIRSIFLVLLD